MAHCLGSGYKKKSSENDRLTGHFQSFFLLFFFYKISPEPESEPENIIAEYIC